nr:aldose 1-epimerase [uncultured bacterium]
MFEILRRIMHIKSEVFGLVNDVEVDLFTLSNENRVTVKLTNYGGVITSVETPDRAGNVKNITLGFDSLEEYLAPDYLNSYPYFGALIGRVGNRVSNGEITVEGTTYNLPKNAGVDHLHGGNIGFDRKIWEASTFQKEKVVGVELNYLSKDGEEGYPGNLSVKIVYSLTDKNEFFVKYYAETDKATPVNMTQHAYFNLGDETTVLNHQLQVNSSEITETSEAHIPTGKMLQVVDTPWDFRTKKKIGRDFHLIERGYDNNYSLNNLNGAFVKAAELSEDTSGRILEVFTTQVGMQVYTGYYNPELEVDGETKFGPYSGIALETQHYPDAVNQKHFPITIVRPGERFEQKTLFKFSVQK